MADEPDQITLQDLFRVVNEMRAEVKSGFAQQAEELASIRKVLDDDTATSREVTTLGDKIAMVQTDVVTVKEQTRETAGQLRRLQSRIDRAGVPAE